MNFPHKNIIIATTLALSVPLVATPALARPSPRAANPEPETSDEAVVERVEGRRAQVRGATVARWPIGLPVVVREDGEAEDALQLAAGVVLTRAADRAIVLLEEGAPPPPLGARVEPR